MRFRQYGTIVTYKAGEEKVKTSAWISLCFEKKRRRREKIDEACILCCCFPSGINMITGALNVGM